MIVSVNQTMLKTRDQLPRMLRNPSPTRNTSKSNVRKWIWTHFTVKLSFSIIVHLLIQNQLKIGYEDTE